MSSFFSLKNIAVILRFVTGVSPARFSTTRPLDLQEWKTVFEFGSGSVSMTWNWAHHAAVLTGFHCSPLKYCVPNASYCIKIGVDEDFYGCSTFSHPPMESVDEVELIESFSGQVDRVRVGLAAHRISFNLIPKRKKKSCSQLPFWLLLSMSNEIRVSTGIVLNRGGSRF